MGKYPLHCNIVSYYKAHYGSSGQGNLLMAVNHRTLIFNGTSENSVFVRENSGRITKFYITLDGVKYGICELNGTIILKENDATPFRVKPYQKYLPVYFIKAKKSNLYLTSDENGKAILCPKSEVIGKKTGWFFLPTPSVDDVDYYYNTLNNNNNNNVESSPGNTTANEMLGFNSDGVVLESAV